MDSTILSINYFLLIPPLSILLVCLTILLVTLWRMERVLEAKLYKKYANPALSRAKASLKKIAKAPTTVTNKIVKQTNKMLNGGIKRK